MKTPKELQPGAAATRILVIDAATRGAVDVDARTVELAFSSETGVERYFGIEVLDHGPKSIRLDRLQNGGPVLMDHRNDDLVGVIESVQIGADKVARAVVRFGKGARASEVFQDVVDGIRRCVSVGYRVHAAILEETRDGVDTYRITDWEPFEVSLVSVPADISVGVGRSAPSPKHSKESAAMTEKTTTDATVVDNRAAIDQAARTGAEAERKRVADIIAVGEQYGAKYPAVRELAFAAASGTMSVDEFRAKALDQLAAAPKPTAEIGMDQREVKRYSLTRALHFLANPNDGAARRAAEFEIECSRAAAERSGKTPSGLMVPFDVLQRDLTVGTSTAGGNLVSTDLQSGSFIDMLRAAMVLDAMGVTFLPGLVGNIAIPKQTGAATAYWVAESGAPTESQQAIGQVAMSPKTVGAYTDISRKLLLQSSIAVEQFVANDLARVLGLAIQAAAISGGGTNQPTGILSTVGIGDVAGGTNGAAPTWDHIVDLETDVSVANADVGTLGYLTNAKVRGKLKKTFVDAGSGERVWDKGEFPLNGYRAGVTNAVASNLTKGTASGVCSAIIYGNFADLVIGLWGGLDITVDPYSQSTSGTVRVVNLQDVDVALRNAESFSAMLDALTT